MPENPDRLIYRRPGAVVGVFVPLSEEEAARLNQPDPDDDLDDDLDEYDDEDDEDLDDDTDDGWDSP